MKTKLKIIILVAAMAASATAHAAPRIGYFINGTPMIGGGAESDNMLSSSDIAAAMLDGIGAAGISLDVSKTGGTYVAFTFMTIYSPTLSNLRVMSGGVALRENVTVRGKSRNVAICSRTLQAWRAGPSEQSHVEALLEGIREEGSAFAKHCLR